MAIGVLCAAAGVWVSSMAWLSRRLVPFGGGVLFGVAVFWVLPEMAQAFRWAGAVAWLAGGFLLLWIIDRYVYPVCPVCAPAHEHGHCATRLHGFAMPLLAAAALHNALDGWSLAVGAEQPGFGLGLTAGIAAHKMPEGLALGVIARAALPSRSSALLWCSLAQAAMPAGALLASAFAGLGSSGVRALLAIAGGSFLYLGWHAVHGELRRSGPRPTILPALTGMAGSSVLRMFVK
jgi:zinc transporter ZupT